MALPANISKDFIDDILKPYRKHAQYLKSAELTHFQDKCSCATKGKDAGLITAKGRFSIPESCYIDDTGHFNAVEFNICFNQLAYVCLRQVPGSQHPARTCGSRAPASPSGTSSATSSPTC